MTGRVHSIESFGAVDGPSIRMVIFLSGCPMRCLYCHNPDTWDPKGGTPMTAEDMLNQYEQTRPFYKKGDIIVDSGEPPMQISFVAEPFERVKKRDIYTCLDTSGIIFSPGSQAVMAHFDRLLVSTNLILLDVKRIGPEGHMKLCSQPQDNIPASTGHLEKKRIPVRTRHMVIPDITDWREYLYRLGHYLGTLKNVEALDVLPYHDMGRVKYHQLGIPYPLKDTTLLPPIKTAEARKIILQRTCDERTHCS